MNFRKIRKNAKALSPVVASIILIAVTVAVSIAVAVWMGGLTTNFMQTEQIQITNVAFNYAGQSVTLTVNNTGTSGVTINEFWVNNVKQTYTPQSISANNGTVATVTSTVPVTIGNNYQMKLVSAKGNNFPITAIAP